MMISEFIDRTGYEPDAREYRAIEAAYYDFYGDKDQFCKHWLTEKKAGRWELRDQRHPAQPLRISGRRDGPGTEAAPGRTDGGKKLLQDPVGTSRDPGTEASAAAAEIRGREAETRKRQ